MAVGTHAQTDKSDKGKDFRVLATSWPIWVRLKRFKTFLAPADSTSTASTLKKKKKKKKKNNNNNHHKRQETRYYETTKCKQRKETAIETTAQRQPTTTATVLCPGASPVLCLKLNMKPESQPLAKKIAFGNHHCFRWTMPLNFGGGKTLSIIEESHSVTYVRSDHLVATQCRLGSKPPRLYEKTCWLP